jgi:cytochrome oxidase Cu insertion factor (SCO1/SenC/PrrC family)
MTVSIIVGFAVLAAVLAVVVAVGAAGRSRQPTDDIASFRRQIDALSPEARRQTSDRMKPSERSTSGDDGVDDT